MYLERILFRESQPDPNTYFGEFKMKILGLVLLLGLLVPLHAWAQPRESARPAFEAASIKLSGPTMGSQSDYRGERFFSHGFTLKYLITYAYGIQDYELSGGPDWIGTIRYDVDAKTAGTVPDAQVRLMIQSLLEDRFKLKIRREEREAPAYLLVIAKGGPKLEKSSSDAGTQSVFVSPSGVITFAGSDKSAPVIRKIPSGPHASLNSRSVSGLADSLARMLGRRVIDKTGIEGSYSIYLEWAPPGGGQVVSGAASSVNAPVQEPSGPSIFDAIQEQLGLKLEQGKANTVFITIDGVEKPSEN
jgi:uncharacterized protein (TIGR03435 family)